MKCWFCSNELICQNDYDYEDYDMEGQGIVTILQCSNDRCNAVFEGYLPIEEVDNY